MTNKQNSAPPGEAVRDAGATFNDAGAWLAENFPNCPAIPNHSIVAMLMAYAAETTFRLESELSTLRRERDQDLKDLAAAMDRYEEAEQVKIPALEAQVRELTALKDEIDRMRFAAESEVDQQDKELAELRSTVERLEGAAQAQLQNLENWEISYNKLYERATMLERDLADRKKGL